MIFNVLPWLLDWVTVRVLDMKIAAEDLPGWLATLGVLLFAGGAAILAGWVTRAWMLRRLDGDAPQLELLTQALPWLAEPAHTEPPVRMRRTHRYPIARHVPAPKRVPGTPPSEWKTITLPRVEDSTVTVPIRRGIR